MAYPLYTPLDIGRIFARSGAAAFTSQSFELRIDNNSIMLPVNWQHNKNTTNKYSKTTFHGNIAINY